MKIIGVAGTNGSGKDTVSRILADDYGWLFVSVSEDLLIPELKKLGLPLQRGQMAALGAKWRKDQGMGAIIDRAVNFCKAKDGGHAGIVISSLRHPGEADRVHELGGQVVWVDADPRVRYERIASRGQGDKDQKSYQQFMDEESAEMAHHSGDDATLNMAGVKTKADIFIENNGRDMGAFKKQVKKSLSL